ncbi:MAG: hypothetical protein HYX47_12730 [Burkholderiales bacterium]|nr:hypothetical protein [Burkholderiales bacterium]
MSPNQIAGTVAVPVSIKPAQQCAASWPRVFAAAGWRVFGKRCTGTLRRDWLAKHEEHVFAFHQVDDVACVQELLLPHAQADGLLKLLSHAGLV